MGTVTHLECLACGARSAPSGDDGPCAICGGIRDVFFDLDAARATLTRESLAADPDRTVRRYAPLLPIEPDGAVTPLAVGLSPIYDSPRAAAAIGVRQLFVKDDGSLPTGSFKDRASYVGIARALAAKASVVAAASTGNAATSVAGLGASVGLPIHIFVPATAPEGKVAQLLTYGAEVFLVDADYDATYDFCQEAVAKFGWYNRSAAVNPYLVEGKKTCGHEIAEQLADTLPDWVAMSVGDGCSIAGTYKGLAEMKAIGLVDRVPKMLGVQAAGAAPLTKAFDAGQDEVERIVAKTFADSINVGMPRNPTKALRAVRASGGRYVNVTDDSIRAWIPKLAKHTGVFGEPAAVTAIAGVEEAVRTGIIGPGESVLVVVSGNGLKDVKSAMSAVEVPAPIPRDLGEVERRLEARR
ncbi:MAG: threonine synthase [Deltaproteobacteria bacterium]